MKRFMSILFMLVLSIGLLVGCGSGDADPSNAPVDTDDKTEETATTEAPDFPLELTDALGNEVTIEEEPEKIVSLMPSNTEIVFALDFGDKIIGVNDFDTYPEEVEDIDTIGGMELDIEKIIGLDPDLVLAHGSSAEGSLDALEQLRDAGITLFVVTDAQSIDATYTSIEEIGTLTGSSDKATEIISEMKEGFAEIEEKVEGISEEDQKSVFMEVSPEPDIYTGGKNTFFHELLTTINAVNAAEEQDGWVQLDPEAIVSLNPDVIITTYGDYIDNPAEQVLAREGWGEVNAIKEEHVFDVDADLVSRPGPRLVEGAKEIAESVYPELFKE